MHLKMSRIDTPLGQMLAIADDKALHSLEFVPLLHSQATCGKTAPLEQIEGELHEFFSGTLREFKTPLLLTGTPFQKKVWEELLKIPFGNTKSYAEIALAMGKPSAFRAVALANRANKIALVIPCHRVIYKNGTLGGYAGGVSKKEWLLQHERR